METQVIPGLVSVIIRGYNRPHYIGQAIDSVLTQTHPHYEILVVDNGSEVDLAPALRPYGQKVRYIYTKRGTVSHAANVGIDNTSGEFIAFLDDDDRWDPQMLKRGTEALKAAPGIDVASFHWTVFSDTDPSPRGWSDRRFLDAASPGADLLGLVCEDNFVAMSSAVMRRSAVTAVGCFDDRFEVGEDWDLWARLLHSGSRIKLFRESLLFLRQHDHKITGQGIKVSRQEIVVLKKMLTYVNPRYRAAVMKSLAIRRRILGEHLCRAGDKKRGLAMMLWGVASRPWYWDNNRKTADRVLAVMCPSVRTRLVRWRGRGGVAR